MSMYGASQLQIMNTSKMKRKPNSVLERGGSVFIDLTQYSVLQIRNKNMYK